MATTDGVSRSAMARRTRPGSAPPRSSLLTKMRVGMRRRRRARSSTRVWACTPSTAETTSTAPSSTLSTRSTSAMKSGWPGVSIRLMVVWPTTNDTTAALMVMPRWRSRSRVSVWLLPWSTLPISSMTPAAYSSRSVRVVLPASTWARIPRLTVSTKRSVLACRGGARPGGHERGWHLGLLGAPGSVGATSSTADGRPAGNRIAGASPSPRAPAGPDPAPPGVAVLLELLADHRDEVGVQGPDLGPVALGLLAVDGGVLGAPGGGRGRGRRGRPVALPGGQQRVAHGDHRGAGE